MRRCSIYVLAALLVGCSGVGERLQPVTPLEVPPASAEEAADVARQMAAQGQWSQALTYLDAASLSLSDDAALGAARAEIETARQQRLRLLRDRMLVAEAECLHERIELLEALSTLDPDDLLLTARRIYAGRQLEGSLGSLVDCAEHHQRTHPELAQRCVEAASWLDLDTDQTTRLDVVGAQLREREASNQRRQAALVRSRRQAQVRSLLSDARVAIKSQDYRRALDILDRVARLQPNHPDIAGLQQEALALLTPQVEALVRLGDHLYLDEQLEAAIAAWQAAFTLQPDDDEIQARIDRANKVLDNLSSLRRQQAPAVTPGLQPAN
jgi:tetratricopeptide (TPR) repeat protein